jgi:tetratricopeptide (TPR) repeat protein
MPKFTPDEAVYNDSMSRSGRSVRHKGEKIDSFEDRLDSLFEELAFAVHNDRPSILLLPYASEYNRADVELALEKRLGEIEQQLVQFMVDEKQFDLPLLLSRRADRKKSVYSIFSLSAGGGKNGANAYLALNIRRELLVDYHVRALFWLTRAESRKLSRHAPDFWAFRHRVVEFDRPSDLNRLAVSGGESPLAAVRAARKAVRLAPLEAGTWLNLGNLCLEVGLFTDARKAFEHVLALAPRNSSGWLGLAHVQRQGKRLSDAIINYRQALGLDPHNLSANLSLIACHRLMGRDDLAEAQKELVRPVVEKGSEYDQGVFASVCGNADQAVEWLAIALAKHQVGLSKLKRDPNLDFIRADARYLQLFAPPPNGSNTYTS